MDEYEIKKGIPVPEEAPTNALYRTILKMEVGDCIEIEGDSSNAHFFANSRNRVLVCRPIKGKKGWHRVWLAAIGGKELHGVADRARLRHEFLQRQRGGKDGKGKK
jgi:hypothetical protein